MRGANQISTFSALESLAVGTLLVLLLALSGCGAGKVTVPDVTGKDPQTAYDLLHKAGLKVTIDNSFSYSDGSYFSVHPHSPVVVTSQQPRAGEVVSRGSSVSTSLAASGFVGVLYVGPVRVGRYELRIYLLRADEENPRSDRKVVDCSRQLLGGLHADGDRFVLGAAERRDREAPAR